MDEGPPEVPDRFPDRVVQKGTAAADAAMQLSRDIAGLFFHPIGIVLPCGEQAVEVIPRDGKDVDGGTDARPPTLPAAQPLIDGPASRFVKGPGLRREEQRIVRRIDLNIGGTEANQLRDLITEDCDDVGEEVLKACIRGLRTFRTPEIHEQAGAGQAYLCDAACAAAYIDKLLGGKMPFAHEPADHAEIDRAIAAPLPDRAVAMPMAPQECIDVPGAEAVNSLGHLALKRKPLHFTVGHDVEPR